MEETDQQFEDLLHYLNLPAALAAPVRSLRISAGKRPSPPDVRAVRRTRDEEPGAPTVTLCAARSQVHQTSSSDRVACVRREHPGKITPAGLAS